MLYRLLRPALFRLDPERAHSAAFAALKLVPQRPAGGTPRLACEVAGIAFPNPVGLAAGFDKDAVATDALLGLGFGFVEIGSVTPLPQTGNPRPRLFRLADDGAIINRMGFNNEGAQATLGRLTARSGRGGVVGVNIGANKDSPDRVADYVTMTRTMAPLASYLAVNISSPNTPGLRALQDEAALADLLDAVLAARDEAIAEFEKQAPVGRARATGRLSRPPVFLKVAPDLTPRDVDAIARIVIERRLGALIVSNTTVERPGLRSAHAEETGGLSGAPLKPLALQRLRDFRQATGGALPLVGVGGIGSAMDAWERIRAGASLVQLYTAMIYRGPGIARSIAAGLDYLVEREGFQSIAEAVGTE